MRLKRSAVAVACVAHTFPAAPGARAASFECARAKSRTEHIVCSTRALDDQDVRMAVLLDVIAQFELMGGRAQQRDDQWVWLRKRDACGGDVVCLRRAYDRRVSALRSEITALPGANG